MDFIYSFILSRLRCDNEVVAQDMYMYACKIIEYTFTITSNTFKLNTYLIINSAIHLCNCFEKNQYT